MGISTGKSTVNTVAEMNPALAPRAGCRACGGEADIFFRAPDVPANSCLLIPTREEALRWPRGEIALAFCPDCGFIFNAAFDPSLTEYSARYEETQGFSATFQTFQEQLAADLVRRHDLHGRTILEIGCGKGEFLARLCALGGNRGLGFDPAFVEERRPAEGAFQVIRDFFSDRYADRRADFVCCKMTLEHVPEPAQLVRAAARAVTGSAPGVVFFQVPDVTRILRDCAFEDVYYEHCSYFTPETLTELFRRCGLSVIGGHSAFAEQYFTIEARPEAAVPAPAAPTGWFDQVREWTRGFAGEFQRRRTWWRSCLTEMHTAGRRVAIWGSGSKGVAFLTALDLGEEIDCVVDINPHRQGCFMAGTGHPIVAPAHLQQRRPDAVIIMNAVYREEISGELKGLGLAPGLLTMGSGDGQ